MGVRSYIGIVRKNGNVEFAYCHNYGGLDENGGILFSYYGKNEIEELLKGGEISVLDFEISTTYFYEKNNNFGTKKFDDLENALNNFKKNKDIEYIYLYFEKENKWYVDSNYYRVPNLKSLEQELIKYEKKNKVDVRYKKTVQMNLY